VRYSFYQTKNIRTIKKIIFHNSIQNYLLNYKPDSTNQINFEKLCDPNLIIYATLLDFKICGLIFFTRDKFRAIVDNGFLPHARGKDACRLSERVIKHYAATEPVRFLNGKIRLCNKQSLVFAKWHNFKVISQDNDYYYVERDLWAV